MDPANTPQSDRAIRAGTRTVLIAQAASQLISLVVLAVLFRTVERSDFGLVGMTLPVLVLTRLLASFGLNIAVIQEPQLDRSSLSGLFWVNLLLAALAAALMSASGPLIARLFDAPLTWLCVGLSFSLVVGAAGSLHQALLERQLRLAPLAKLRILAQLLAGLAAVAAALSGWGVWALVTQQYVELAALTAGAWYLEPWRPAPPWQQRASRALLRFGGHYSLSSLMFYVAQQVDKLSLSRVLGGSPQGQSALGMYTQAFQLMIKPVYLVTNPVSVIMLPALAQARGRPQEYREIVERFLRMIAILLFPVGIGLAIVGVDTMVVLGGEEWRAAGWMLAVLAPTIAVQGLINICGTIFASQGRADRLLFGSIVIAVLLTQGVLAGIWFGSHSGLAAVPARVAVAESAGENATIEDNAPLGTALGVALAYTAVTVIVLAVPYLIYCLHSVDVPAKAVARSLRFPLLATACMGSVTWGFRLLLLSRPEVPSWLRLVLVIACGALTYVVLARRELRWFLTHLAR